jgi:hypothetical protein
VPGARSFFPFFVILVFVLVPALAHGAGTPPAHREKGDLAIRARDIFLRYCAECHTGSAEPGQSKLDIRDHKQLIAKGPPVPFVAPGGRSQVLELIKDGSMPPANRPGPKPAEVAVLERWIEAGAPAYPRDFDDRYVLETVAGDVALVKPRDGGPYPRYISFAHLVRDGHPPPDLATAERELKAALALVVGHPVALEPVDDCATCFRIDPARLGWWTGDLFERVERRRPAGAFTLRPFDLVLLEYPFGELLPPDALAKQLEPLTGAAAQVRPVPFVRGDWFTSALVRGGKLTPLAEDIRSLTALDKARGASEKEPDGPPVPRALGTAEPLRVTRQANGRVPLPPLSGWYTGDVAPDPAPFALSAELVANGKPIRPPVVAVDQRFKLEVRCNQRVHLLLLMVQADGEVRVQEVEGGGVLVSKMPRELSPNGEGFSISGIITGGTSATEYFVLFAAERELPLPTIVRSTHPDRPVWRFLFDPGAKEPFAGTPVVRKVIPIPVTKR